jgi:carboxylesterase
MARMSGTARLVTLFATTTAAAGAFAWWHRRVVQTADRAFAARCPAGADGVVLGAAAIRLIGTSSRAVLLLHGSGDTPQSLRYLADRLHAAGYSVHVPLLPGHGRSPRAFRQVSAHDYLAAARAALEEARAHNTWVAVAGLSMGGALAVQLAAEAPDVPALVLLAPYLIPPATVRWGAALSWIWGLVVPFVAGRGERSMHDTEAAAAGLAYGSFPPRAMRALVATAARALQALPRVAAPTLVINSEQDNRIPAALATEALRTLQAPSERHWVSGCGHVITADYCKSTVADLILAFLARQS